MNMQNHLKQKGKKHIRVGFLQQDLNYTQLQSENLEGSLISLSYETQGQSPQHK